MGGVTDSCDHGDAVAPAGAGSRNVPPLACESCGRAIAPDAVAFYWHNSALGEPWCGDCMASQAARRGWEADPATWGWFWDPYGCESCERPMRGRRRGRTNVCSEPCRGALRRRQRADKLASPHDLECQDCGQGLGAETHVVWNAGRGSGGPYCTGCGAARRADADLRFLQLAAGMGASGLVHDWRARRRSAALPGEDGYDPYDGNAGFWPCPVCERQVSGRRFCCDRCEAEFDNVVRRVQHEQRACERCGVMFTPKRADSRYHSNACRQAAYRERVTDARGPARRAAPPTTESRNGD